MVVHARRILLVSSPSQGGGAAPSALPAEPARPPLRPDPGRTDLGGQDLLARDAGRLFRGRHVELVGQDLLGRGASAWAGLGWGLATWGREPIPLGAVRGEGRSAHPNLASLMPQPACQPSLPLVSTNHSPPLTMSGILLSVGKGFAVLVGGFATIVLLNVLYQLVSLWFVSELARISRRARARSFAAQQPQSPRTLHPPAPSCTSTR